LLSSVSYFHIGKRNLNALTAGVTAASLVVSGVSPAFAQGILPTNGSVAAGSVSIGSSGSVLTVTQGSNQAIVNWGSFSIGQGNTVNFVQPDASSAILNRVTGSTSSTIAGALNANGQVYLINPNGITITSSGTVNAGGGFVASTLDMSDEDFLKGQYRFSGNGSSAQVSNEGVITIGRGGYAALIGGTVRNDGLIAVPLGKVGLGSGEQATLDLSGDGFLQVALPTAEGAEGGGALIENSGQISAEGGTVVMKAATARNAARHAVNLSGSVEADSISGSDGEIVIGGGEGGKVTVSGKVSAKSASGKGGRITVTGQQVALKGAEVDASGATGGGTVKIGGDWQGTGTTQRAETTSIDAASIIRADATQSGNGGTVVVWSDNLTTFAGLISAQGAGTGTGGEAEVSGKAVLSYTGHTDLGGPGGFGNLLLDPYNITISSGTASNSTGTTATGDDSVISVSTLVSALASANVTITTGASGSAGSQAGTITVADAVTWTSGSTLTLSAYGDIIVNANLTGGTGSSIVLRADNSGTGAGTVTFGSGVTATASGGVSLYYNPAGNDNSSVNVDAYASPTAFSSYAGTSTTITAYMLVNTVYDLQNMQNNLSGTYALGRDIDASATASWNGGGGFSPIGNEDYPFMGIFDGLGHTISGLVIGQDILGYAGLFASSGGEIRNVGLLDVEVTGGKDYAGALVGYLSGTISNSYVTGTVTGGYRNYTGGLVGYMIGGSITGSYSTATVNGARYTGGLVGGMGIGTITNSYATGSVSSGVNDYAGGLVGYADLSSTIETSYATGSVSGGQYVGGLAGYGEDLTISNSYATGAVTGTDSAGGLVGYATGSMSGTNISNSYASGAVTGGTNTGGLVGNLDNGSVTSSYFDTETTGQTQGVGSDASASGVTGLTTAYARTASSYSGWDFTNVWYQSADMRPILRSEAAAVNADGVITISNLHQLALMATNLTASYLLTVDLDASGTDAQDPDYDASGIWGEGGWVPIGTNTAMFSGTLNGNGHTISGLTINRSTTDYVGLIGYGNSASLHNIGLTDVNITGKNYVGALAGFTTGSAIDTAYSTGSVSGAVRVGGLLGQLFTGGRISNSYSAASVYATSNASGGLAGYVRGTVSNSYATGNVVSLANDVGGLIGSVHASAVISNTYATGSVTGVSSIGGLIGSGTGTITASFFNTETTGQTQGVGGSASASGVTGLTTAQMTSFATFDDAGWDIADEGGSSAVWRIYEGQTGPLLRSFLTAITINGGTTGSKTYDGTASSTSVGTLTYSLADYDASLLLGTAVYTASSANAGTYTSLTLSGLYSGQTGYDISYGAGSGTFTINKAALEVSVTDAVKTYDGQAFTGGNGVTYDGFVNGETSTVLGGTLSYGGASQNAVNAGSYTLMASGLSSDNYDISYVDGTLTVDKAALEVTVADAVKTYDGLSFTGGNGVTYDGFVNGETSTVLGGTLVYGGTSQNAVNAGDYTLTASGLTSGNYEITYVAGTLTVDKAALEVTVTDAVKTYDGLAFTGGNGVSYSGFVNGETSTVLGGTLSYGGTSQGAVNAGDYTLTASGLTSDNYDISYVDGSLTVDKAVLTVTAANASKTYDGQAFSGGNGVSYSGFVNSETSAVLGGTLAYGGTSQGAVNAGSYVLTPMGLTSLNYDISFVSGTLVISGASVVVPPAIVSILNVGTTGTGYAGYSGSSSYTYTSTSASKKSVMLLTSLPAGWISQENEDVIQLPQISGGNQGEGIGTDTSNISVYEFCGGNTDNCSN
jgi:filamentous hemagglutinin family protein